MYTYRIYISLYIYKGYNNSPILNSKRLVKGAKNQNSLIINKIFVLSTK